jgi:hypothetical protein
VSDADFKLLLESLRSAYRDVNPELSEWGANLLRRLADGLYTRGARIQIGAPAPTRHIFIHHSLDPLGHVLWTCRRWNAIMGFNNQAPVGRHISEFLEPGSFESFKEQSWPELIRNGKVENVPVILVTSTRDYLNAIGKSEILHDERGGFLRTFAKLKVAVPAALERLGVA